MSIGQIFIKDAMCRKLNVTIQHSIQGKTLLRLHNTIKKNENVDCMIERDVSKRLN